MLADRGDTSVRRSNQRNTILVTAAALVAGALLLRPEHSTGAEYLGYALRVTAWISAVFFLLAYIARPLARCGWTGWLVQNRRYLGLSVALSHTVHFGYIVALSRLPDFTIDVQTLVVSQQVV